jgi:hypothetical protein
MTIGLSRSDSEMFENVLLPDEMDGNVSAEHKNMNNESETEILDYEGTEALRDKKNSEYINTGKAE